MTDLNANPGDLVEAIERDVCKRLARWAAPHKLPNTNKHNIVVWHNRKELLIRFVFVTRENMKLQYDVDLREMMKRGPDYLDLGIHKLRLAIEDFTKARQEKEIPIFIPSDNQAAKVVGEAIRSPLH